MKTLTVNIRFERNGQINTVENVQVSFDNENRHSLGKDNFGIVTFNGKSAECVFDTNLWDTLNWGIFKNHILTSTNGDINGKPYMRLSSYLHS